jgi:ZIP family zinc transporter
MNPLLEAIFLSLIAGAAIPLGGVVASIERIQPAWLENEFRHTVISFGGGALFAAVALVLIPESIQTLSILSVSISFISGAIVFLAIDYVIAQRGGTISQVIAMLLDFIPEAMALGAVFSKDASKGLLIAFLIGIQNLPEGFNAYREIMANRYCSGRTALIIFTGLAFLGPLSAFIGIIYLAGNETLLNEIMVFCAGGILYLIFQDIAPQAKLRKHWAPSLGAIAGFLLGVVGSMIITIFATS